METTKQTKSQRFYQLHKTEILERNKEKVKCECGSFITPNNISKHRKTMSHMLKAKIIKYEFIPDDDE